MERRGRIMALCPCYNKEVINNIYKHCPGLVYFRFKGVVNGEIKIPLIFKPIKGYCMIKTLSFRSQNFLASLKSLY